VHHGQDQVAWQRIARLDHLDAGQHALLLSRKDVFSTVWFLHLYRPFFGLTESLSGRYCSGTVINGTARHKAISCFSSLVCSLQ
jgi:hypothetical protein